MPEQLKILVSEGHSKVKGISDGKYSNVSFHCAIQTHKRRPVIGRDDSPPNFGTWVTLMQRPSTARLLQSLSCLRLSLTYKGRGCFSIAQCDKDVYKASSDAVTDEKEG